MSNLHANKQKSPFPRQNEFIIGKPKNDKHPLDEVSDNDLRAALSKSSLSERAVSDAIGLKGKFRDLLMTIVEANSKGDEKMVYILADTLAVGMGYTDPRRQEYDPPVNASDTPAHAKRSWHNG